MTRLIVADAYNDARIDVFLSENIDGLSRNTAQRIISEGHVTINNRGITKNTRLKTGDEVVCITPSPTPSEAEAEAIPLDIVYEDADIIVINKPQRMVVHPAAGHHSGTLVNALLHHCGDSLSGIGGAQRPGIVHRLDKDTSGLIVVAKNDAAHSSLTNQLANREIGRIYQAICLGNIKKDSQDVNVPIGRHPQDRKKMAPITHEKRKSREALTHISVLERMPRFTLIEAKLHTGRTHQIRVHLSYMGHPVLGDLLYGLKKPPLGLTSQVLHAKKLSLRHPSTNELMDFEIPLPDYFLQALEKVRRVT
ncbi:MAG: RluA family pseudouridine synthase [Defluviitaleaceae bacterium]|nr:RluA family pseudouridine synthase [Defluviitaleaceae bacterium]